MHYAIIGNGVAGVNAALELRRRDDRATISIIADESDYFYSRTALMWGYTGQLKVRDMEPFERSVWGRLRLDLVHDRVDRIEPEKRLLHLASGKTLHYDKLLLAVGAAPNLFGWPGQDLQGVGTFTSLADLENLVAMRERIRRAVVVGGGLIGIELIEIMLQTGVATTFLLREPWYWDRALDQREAAIVQQRIEQHGARVIVQDEIGEIRGEGGWVTSVVTKKGEELPCDFVGIAVGVHPNTALCADSSIRIGRGIAVDPAMKTSVPSIWSAGDCAQIHYPENEQPVIEQLWYTGIHQGRAAARSMLGDRVHYERGIAYNAAQFLTYDFCTVGQMKQFRPTAKEAFDRGTYYGREWTCRIAHENDEVVGLAMMGPRWDSTVMMRWIEERRTLAYCRAHLDEAVFNEEFVRRARMELRHA